MRSSNSFPELPARIPQGDMPGDRICIGEEHIAKARTIYPLLREELEKRDGRKTVVTVCGGSGVGKSEIASVLAYYLNQEGIGAYIMSGDNYPRRIPRDNDLERVRVFRQGGLYGLVDHDLLTPEVTQTLRGLWAEEKDADPEETGWLSVYQKAGRRALTAYLGTPRETNFDEVTEILARFHQGDPAIYLKRMGRETTELWYEKVHLADTRVLILEWTHGNSDDLEGVDFPILLNSTPAETLAHRRARNRDGKIDSAFTTMVLEIEQKKLEAQAYKAKIILSKQGEILSYADYRRLMANE